MATGTTAQQTIDVVTPAAGESVTEGTILEWHVKVGDFIKADDTIVEISTDKVDLELPSPASGTVSEILIEEGATVTVGQVIARIALNSPAPAPTDANGGHATAQQATAPASDGSPAEAPEGVKVSPVAARAAAVEGVNLATVPGSGPAGRITKSDVLAAASGNGAPATVRAPSNGGATAAPGANARPIRGSAAALARYMEQSREIPTATSFRTLTVTVLDARRRELKAAEPRARRPCSRMNS